MLAGLQPSIGTVGDAYDNALAETTIGLYKTECVRESSPFRTGPLMTLADLEEITSAWVCWYNTSRLMHRLGLRPPPKPRPSTISGTPSPTRVRHTSNEECIKPRSVHPQPARDRLDRRPLGRVVPRMLADQPDRLSSGARVIPAAWHRAIFLPTEGGAHETRVSSSQATSAAGSGYESQAHRDLSTLRSRLTAIPARPATSAHNWADVAASCCREARAAVGAWRRCRPGCRRMRAARLCGPAEIHWRDELTGGRGRRPEDDRALSWRALKSAGKGPQNACACAVHEP
jgi:Integrase core domain